MAATLISEQSSASASSITFSSIPASYEHLRLYVRVSAQDNSSGNNDLALRINGVSTNSYAFNNGRSYGSGTSAATTTPQRQSDRQQNRILLTPSGSNNSATPAGTLAIIDFGYYRTITGDKNCLYYVSNPRNAGGTYQSNSDFIIGVGQIVTQDVISSLTVLSNSRSGLLWRASLWGY